MLLVSIPTWGHAAAEGPRARSGRQLRVSGASVRSLTETPTNKEKVRGAVRLSGQILIWMHMTHSYAASLSILAGRHVAATGQRNPDKLDYWIDCNRL